MDGNGDGHQVLPKVRISFRGARREYLFDPAVDVTAQELSEALVLIYVSIPVMAGATPPVIADKVYDGLSDAAKRHFQTRELSSIVVAR
jgi:hypothetical protein